MSETAGDKSWKTVTFDNGNQIQVEVPPGLRGCFTIQGEGSMQLDLLLQDADGRLGVWRTPVLVFDHLLHQSGCFFGGNPRVRKQVFEHADWVTDDQALLAWQRTDGPILRQPIRSSHDLPLIQSEESVIRECETRHLETTGGAKLECPLGKQAAQRGVDVWMFDEVPTP